MGKNNNAVIIIVIIVIVLILIGIIVYYIFYFGDSCSLLIEGLPDISDVKVCIDTKNVKYMSDLNMLVSPVPQSSLILCKGFCQSFDNTNDHCVGTNDDKLLYEACIKSTFPDNKCTGLAKPVAISDDIPYYGLIVAKMACITTPD